MTPTTSASDDCAPGCACGITRRDLLRAAGSLALLGAPRRAMAGPFTAADFRRMVPEEKKLHPNWVKSLFDRGSPEVYRGTDLQQIGMPVSGLCSGPLY